MPTRVSDPDALGALSERYRDWLHLRRPERGSFDNAADIDPAATSAHLFRVGKSHRGIGTRTALRELGAGAVDQAFLDEIASLADLTYLELAYPVTARDLGPLRRLSKLETLKIDSPRNISDFTPILDLPNLRHLEISNAKHMADIEWLRPLRDRLRVLGIEGSMWTAQTIPTLAPLEGFALEALFLTSTRLGDRSLAPIATMSNLAYLGTARNASRDEFEALAKALPNLSCQWFAPAIWRD